MIYLDLHTGIKDFNHCWRQTYINNDIGYLCTFPDEVGEGLGQGLGKPSEADSGDLGVEEWSSVGRLEPLSLLPWGALGCRRAEAGESLEDLEEEGWMV